MKRVVSYIRTKIISQLSVRNIFLLIVMMVILIMAIIGFSKPISQHLVEVVSIGATLFSALMIVAELHAGKQANKAERLIEGNL